MVESIQLRHYGDLQVTYEFELDRRNSGAMRAIGRDERGFSFVHFMGIGIDAFERYNENEKYDSSKIQSVTLRSCEECHSKSGIESVISYTRMMSALPFGMFGGNHANFTVSVSNEEERRTIEWKHSQYDWGLMQGLSR